MTKAAMPATSAPRPEKAVANEAEPVYGTGLLVLAGEVVPLDAEAAPPIVEAVIVVGAAVVPLEVMYAVTEPVADMVFMLAEVDVKTKQPFFRMHVWPSGYW